MGNINRNTGMNFNMGGIGNGNRIQTNNRNSVAVEQPHERLYQYLAADQYNHREFLDNLGDSDSENEYRDAFG